MHRSKEEQIAARRSILIVLLILLADQTLKILVKTNMPLYQQIPLLGQWASLHFVENNGMAFGLSFPGGFGKILLSTIRIGAVVGIGLYLRHLIRLRAPKGLLITLSMVLAGALGNIIDSVFYGLIFSESTPYTAAVLFPEGGGYASLLHGKVVDMFYFPIIKGNYPEWLRNGAPFIFFRPVFNLADASISSAVILILINQKRYFKHFDKTGKTQQKDPGNIESAATESAE
ncbi:MAG: lipoprotein signal peptidase [Bacteroidetes bacterium]|nr:MAG: lipoprotein signal peptidase [Bacteroidota bacterium]